MKGRRKEENLKEKKKERQQKRKREIEQANRETGKDLRKVNKQEKSVRNQ